MSARSGLPTFNWAGVGSCKGDRIYYNSFYFCGVKYSINDDVYLLPEDEGAPLYVARLLKAFEETTAPPSERLCIEVQWYERKANMPAHVQSTMEDCEVVASDLTDINLVGCIDKKAVIIRASSKEEALSMVGDDAGDWLLCRGTYYTATGEFKKFPELTGVPPMVVAPRSSAVRTTLPPACTSFTLEKGSSSAGQNQHKGEGKHASLEDTGSPKSAPGGNVKKSRHGRPLHGNRAYSPVSEPLPPAPPKPKGLVCVQCGSTRTPQWREGPMGPKTLCNACGVRYHRQRSKQNFLKRPAPSGGDGQHSPSKSQRASKSGPGQNSPRRGMQRVPSRGAPLPLPVKCSSSTSGGSPVVDMPMSLQSTDEDDDELPDELDAGMGSDISGASPGSSFFDIDGGQGVAEGGPEDEQQHDENNVLVHTNSLADPSVFPHLGHELGLAFGPVLNESGMPDTLTLSHELDSPGEPYSLTLAPEMGGVEELAPTSPSLPPAVADEDRVDLELLAKPMFGAAELSGAHEGCQEVTCLDDKKKWVLPPGVTAASGGSESPEEVVFDTMDLYHEDGLAHLPKIASMTDVRTLLCADLSVDGYGRDSDNSKLGKEEVKEWCDSKNSSKALTKNPGSLCQTDGHPFTGLRPSRRPSHSPPITEASSVAERAMQFVPELSEYKSVLDNINSVVSVLPQERLQDLMSMRATVDHTTREAIAATSAVQAVAQILQQKQQLAEQAHMAAMKAFQELKGFLAGVQERGEMVDTEGNSQ